MDEMTEGDRQAYEIVKEFRASPGAFEAHRADYDMPCKWIMAMAEEVLQLRERDCPVDRDQPHSTLLQPEQFDWVWDRAINKSIQTVGHIFDVGPQRHLDVWPVIERDLKSILKEPEKPKGRPEAGPQYKIGWNNALESAAIRVGSNSVRGASLSSEIRSWKIAE